MYDFLSSGAFVKTFTLEPYKKGALSDLTFAVKDNIDIANYKTSYGSPAWKEKHDAPTYNALCVDQLLESGATCLGKTVSDEFTYSLDGENYFFGTPINPIAPNRIPGGSSSGSASAVACGLVDFAIGTDSAGSIRVPASLCGVYGMRPTMHRISEAGVLPFVPNSTRAVDPQRQALLNAVQDAGSLSEKKEIVFGTRQMQTQGFELLDESFLYRGNQGIDLAFRHSDTGQFAILEAKHGSGLGLLSTYKGPLRQGGTGYNIDRLEKYTRFNNTANVNLAEDLIYGLRSGTVDNYASFYRGNSLYRLDFDNTVNFRLTPEAAIKVE